MGEGREAEWPKWVLSTDPTAPGIGSSPARWITPGTIDYVFAGEELDIYIWYLVLYLVF